MKALPKPLPLDVMEAAVPNDPAEKPTDEDKEVCAFSRQEPYIFSAHNGTK